MVTLSKRLSAVAAFVPEGARLVDVGTDHAYLPIALMQSGKISEAVAADLREGPLEQARIHIDEADLNGRITTRCSDGLKNIAPGDGDVLVIAGMGGMLLLKILHEGDTAHFETMILAPQSDLTAVRRELMELRLEIIKENLVQDGGKYYPVICAVHGTDPDDDPVHLRYGKHLIPEAVPVLQAYLSSEHAALLRAVRQIARNGGSRTAARNRREELENRIRLNEEAARRIKTEQI